MAAASIDESRIRHTSREAVGHFREDNAVNRQALIDVANRPENLLGTDRFGNRWYAEILADGVWARVRGDKIVRGGLNLNPRDFTEIMR